MKCGIFPRKFPVNSTPFAKQDPLAYQKRGNRFEGQKSYPISSSIHFVSATIDGSSEMREWPTEMEVRFWLPANKTPNLIVRENVHPVSFYWLDNANISKSDQDTIIQFHWLTSDVLKPLAKKTHMRPDFLGGFIYFGDNPDAQTLNISPIYLGPHLGLVKVKQYWFTFVVSSPGILKWRLKGVLSGANSLKGSKQMLPSEPMTFTPGLTIRNWSEGKYQLDIDITYSDKGLKSDHRTILFVHKERL
jgi:hypothetical protein